MPYFGKPQKGFTLACSRLIFEVLCIEFVKACSYWTYVLLECKLASDWLIV